MVQDRTDRPEGEMLVERREIADVHFLLVEDDADEAALLRRVLHRSSHHIYCRELVNGRQAVDYIRRVANDSAVGLPDLILLDIQMPVMTGLEFLAWLRADARYNAVQVVVLTGVRDDAILRQALALGANAALNKELRREDADTLRQMIIDMWFHGEVYYFAEQTDAPGPSLLP
ncbi:MAG: response regulator [Hyphomicrobiales bacterium]|nr:response regulator [Hyphomicrobiales bacterium]